MTNHYPVWKNILIVCVIALISFYAIPNLYGEDPAIQISGGPTVIIDDELETLVRDTLSANQIPFQKIERTERAILTRFGSEDEQIRAKTSLRSALGESYIVALNLAPATPDWLQSFGGKPMKLGLDLRGGVHFLMQVDMETALKQREEQTIEDIKRQLREKRYRYKSVKRDKDGGLSVTFRKSEHLEPAYALIRTEFRDHTVNLTDESIELKLTDDALKELRDYAVSQNVITLRNRVNELGVAEPLVQRTGIDRIVVELPGVQDTAEAKRILGATATVEMHAVDYKNDVDRAVRFGAPPESKVYYWRDGRPELLKKRVILSGDHITGASTGVDENNRPQVNIVLDSIGGKKFGDFTAKNVQKPMSVVFVEYKSKLTEENGEMVRQSYKVERVINVATIQQKLGSRFRITGLDSIAEARDLALLLRAGSLAAPIQIIEERTIGPSLGQDNIDKGTLSVQIGFLLVLVFMVVYYKVFGLIANVALAANLVLIVGMLSMIPGATLTLPGIAGIVLTVGMAVDANVLIFQRIKEELRQGLSPQAAIHSGYERAFSTIADANVTTLIAAIVLFAVGTGPIKGFAVTLSIGIITSMFTAIMCTRAIVNAVYGGKKLQKLYI